jgi:ATP-binding cassette subfamily C protein CydCD
MLERRLLQRARASRLALIGTIGAGLTGGLLVIAQARLLSQVVDRVYLGGAGLEAVLPGLLLLAGIFTLRAILVWAGEASANRLANQVKVRLRQELLAHIRRLGPAYAGGQRAGELVNTAVQGVDALDAYFRQYLPQLALAALVPLALLAMVFPIDWISAVILLVTAPLIPLFMRLIGSLADALTRRQWGLLSQMSAYFLDVLQGLPTLKLLGRSRAQIQVIAQTGERYRQVTMDVLRVAFLSALALELLSTLSTALVAVGIGVRLLYGRLTFEDAFFVLLLAPDFYLPLRLLGTRFHAGIGGVSAAQRIFEILEIPLPPGRPPALAAASRSAPPEITFRGVSYTYPGEAQPAVGGVSFTIPAGSQVALVGPSGAGKSSLASLLLGFMHPDQGAILVNGQPLAEIPAEDWRAQVAWLPQRPYLFNDTIAANIRLARPEASLEAVIQAARLARAHDFIAALPQGYETPIGERGARLSGGQAQRIALARAFLKDAPLLILDEAAASLDPALEAEIQAAVRQLIGGRTVLIIAHRLASAIQADQILVLSAGQVVQAGTHAGLIAQEGLYRRLAAASVSSLPTEAGAPLAPALPPPPSEIPETLPPATPAASGAATLPRLLAFLRPLWAWVALSALLGFAAVASGIGLMAASAYIIAAAALQPSIAVIQVPVVGVRFFGLSRGVFRYLERYASHRITLQALARLRTWFYTALEPLAPAVLSGYRSGDLLGRITADIAELENFYVRAVAPGIVALLTAGLSAALLGAYHANLAWTLLAFLGFSGLALPLIVRRASQPAARRLAVLRAGLHAGLVDNIQGLPDLLIYDRGGERYEQVCRLNREALAESRRLADLDALQTAAQLFLANLGAWAVLFLAIPLVSAGQLQGVYLAVLTLAALASFEAVQPVPQAAAQLESSLQAGRRLFELADSPPAVQEPPDPLPVPQGGDLEVRRLTFRYPSRRMDTLQEVSFRLPQGGRLAIVGPSGAGKTALVNLLLRFWDYQQGEILWGGIDLRRLPAEAVRQRIAAVPQHTYLFAASLGENLRLAWPAAPPQALSAAVRQAQLDAFLEALPQGYETPVGEHGLRLSGGERQRLALARALLRPAPLLVLDEPAANLDALTARRVMQAVLQAAEGRSLLLITHRLAGLDAMDEILVLRAGQIVERGDHAGLLRSGGLYARMWRAQNQELE